MADWNTDSRGPTTERESQTLRDRRIEAAFAVGGGVVAVNSSLYFFGVESLSHPILTVVGVVLLVALYVKIR